METHITSLTNLIATSTVSIDYFKMFYTVIGGLGIFLYGMNIFSQVLQSMGSGVIKKFINYVAINRVASVLVGVIITAFVQSSSVSTVMMSSFVNSGLMTLSQGVGFIFGANIGTTITGWIISLNIGKYGLLLIGLGGLPFIFSNNNKVKLIGRLLFCLGLIFFGLELMGNAFRPLRDSEDFKAMMTWFDVSSYWGIIACMLVGCLMTMIIQSSSAMLGITIALASTGNITFPTAAALVLGENIGTTITLWLASLSGARITKQTALAHSTFNIGGCFVAFCIFPIYIKLINHIVPGDPFAVPAIAYSVETADQWRTYGTVISQHIAMVHTLFNVSATLLFLPFINYLVKFVRWAIPDQKQKPTIEETLQYFSHIHTISPTLGVRQVQLVVEQMNKLVFNTLNLTKDFVTGKSTNEATSQAIAEAENEADKIQEEILIFVNRINQSELTPELSRQIQVALHTSDELESITDYCLNIVRHRERFIAQGISLNDRSLNQLGTLMEHTITFYEKVILILNLEVTSNTDINKLWEEYKKLGKENERIKDEHIEQIMQQQYPPQFALTFSELTTAMRRITTHSLNIAEAIEEKK